jgi:uncharacterized delta-60 repeat protein
MFVAANGNFRPPKKLRALVNRCFYLHPFSNRKNAALRICRSLVTYDPRFLVRPGILRLDPMTNDSRMATWRTHFRERYVAALVALTVLCAPLFGDVVVDPTFNVGTGGNNFAEHVVPLPDGKILLCGIFDTFNGVNAPYLVRLNENGDIDPTFATGLFDNWVRHLLIQPDGKIIAVGSFSTVAGQPRNEIARLNPDGTLDPTFNPGTGFTELIVPADPNPSLIFWADLQPDGKIVVVGSFAKFNGQPMSGIARLNPDGTVDPTFQVGAGFNSWGRAVHVLPNGQILANGWFTDYNGFACNRMVSLNPDGSPDPSFHPFFGDLTSIYSAALLSDGKMIVSGHTKNPDAFTRHIARLNPDGSEDPTFVGHTDSRTEFILLQPDGKILINGFFADVDDTHRQDLARLNPDGTLDTSFRADLDSWAWTVAFDRNQKLLVAGDFQTVNGIPSPTIARLIPDLAIGPVLQADPKSITVSEDTSAAVTLSGTGASAASLSYVVLTQPTKGALSGTAPNLTYTPNPNANGADSFTYAVSNGTSQSGPATVTINITPQNDAPAVSSFTVDATAGEGLLITLSGTDVDGDALTLSVVTPPTKGQFSGTAPNITYTPNAGATGSDSFTYKASDGKLESGPGVITIRISALNHAPIASNLTLDTLSGQSLSVALSASDADGDPLTYQILTPPAHATLSGTPPNLTYNSGTFSGTDTFTYIARDATAQSAPASVTIHVAHQNHPPVANSISFSGVGGTPFTVTLQGVDPDSDPLTYTLLSAPSHGQLSGTAPNLTYTAAVGTLGTDSFTYLVSDGTAQSGPGTVTITLGAGNHVPSTASLAVNTTQGQAVGITLVASDEDGDPLTYRVLTQPLKGALSGQAPNLTYTVNPGASGSDSFTYVVSDGKSQSSAGFVSIQIAAAPDTPPVAKNLSLTTREDQALDLVLTGSDPQGNALTYTILTQPSHGLLSGTAPNVSYTPAANANGDDSFTYAVGNGHSQSAAGTVTIHVTPVNDAPTANNLSFAAIGGSPVSLTLTGADVDGDALSFSIISPPAHGTLSGTGPDLTYTPAAGFSGSDTFTYAAGDGIAQSVPATVSLNVTAQNHAPVAAPLTFQAIENRPLSITLKGTDPDGNSLSYQITGQPSAGQVSGIGANIVYTPAADFTGSDSFRYTVSDGSLSSEATVSISVAAPANEPPVGSNFSFDVVAGIPFPVTLGGNDPNGDSVTFQIVTPPAKGQLSGTAPRLTYTASPFSSGPDSFTYQVSDGRAQSALATVTLNIQGSSSLPAPTAGIHLATDGSVVLELNGPANHAYQIEFSNDAAHWQGLSNGTADDSGKAQYRELLPVDHVTLYRIGWR